MGSSIPAVRTAAVDLLTALPALANVDVRRSGASPQSLPTSVLVDNAAEIVREYYLGANQVREEYVIPIRVEVIQEGDELVEVEQAMWTIMAAVEKAVLDSHGFGLSYVSSALPSGMPDGEHSGPASDRQIAAAATVRVEVMAVVSLNA